MRTMISPCVCATARLFPLLVLALLGCSRASEHPSEAAAQTPRAGGASPVVASTTESLATDDSRRFPRRVPEAAYKEFEGEAFIVLPSQQKYKILNEVGTRVWGLLDGEHTPEQIARIVASEYEVTAEEALVDILDFLRELEAAGMLAGHDQAEPLR